MKQAEEKDLTPALTRGLNLLQRIGQDGACSLEQLTHATQWPKSSVWRCLQTLEACGMVARDPVSKRYHAVMKLVAVDHHDATLRNVSRRELDRLCDTCGSTAELHSYADGVLTMIDRSEPEIAELVVRNRIGTVRQFHEYEALTQVVMAFAQPETLPGTRWVWEDGAQTPISAERAADLVTSCRQSGLGRDNAINGHGVQRLAAPIKDHDNSLVAIIAIAASRALDITDSSLPAQALAASAQRIGARLGAPSPVRFPLEPNQAVTAT